MDLPLLKLTWHFWSIDILSRETPEEEVNEMRPRGRTSTAGAGLLPGSATHDRTRILSGVIKPTRTLTQIKAILTADHPPILPPSQPHRDVLIIVLFPTFVREYG
jgi:hypothetical protein